MGGFSITICFGKYGGFYGYIHKHTWRLCLGWMAITVYPKTDLEEFIRYLKNNPLPPPQREE